MNSTILSGRTGSTPSNVDPGVARRGEAPENVELDVDRAGELSEDTGLDPQDDARRAALCSGERDDGDWALALQGERGIRRRWRWAGWKRRLPIDEASSESESEAIVALDERELVSQQIGLESPTHLTCIRFFFYFSFREKEVL